MICATSIGIIGGADGPTAVLVASAVSPWVIGAVVLAVAGIIIAIVIKNK